MQKYISDLIKKEDIQSWETGTNIMITAPTGTGKSTIIMGDKEKEIYGLNDYAISKGKKILFLTNRDLLKGQFKEIIKKNGSNNIKIANYQELEKGILEREDISRFDNFDYIVADECHYFLDDSPFNDTTELSLDWILKQKNNVKIYMSATSDMITRYLEKAMKIELIKYDIKKDYNYIENLYFYNDDDVLKRMIIEIPADEKAIYFGSASNSHDLSKSVDDAKFYCSEYNPRYKKYRDIDTYEQIKNNSKFDCKTLLTTTVMDNGVSIIDDTVKHIIIDVFDIDGLIQCLGRKRIRGNEKINLYIKNYDGGSINGKLKYTKDGLKYADTLMKHGENYLVDKYPRRNYGNIIYEELEGTLETGRPVKKINMMMYIKYKSIVLFCEELLNSKHDNQYIEYISSLLQFKYEDIQLLESHFDAITLENIIDSKFEKLKLFNAEQVELSEIIINELVSVKGVNYRTKKLNSKTLESILREQLKLPYGVSESMRESKGEMRGKRYIIITKLKQ